MPDSPVIDHGRASARNRSFAVAARQLNLSHGCGAIRGIGEEFAANPVTGTGSMSVHIATSRSCSGFGPQLFLSYNSGAGNCPFGYGWNLLQPSVTHKTAKGLPKYQDLGEPDVFILSGTEDLVRALVEANGSWQPGVLMTRKVDGKDYRVQRYRPPTEGLFGRIERWIDQCGASDSLGRSNSKVNITTWYSQSDESRINDYADPRRIYSWLIYESHSDKGRTVAYRYKAERSTIARYFEHHTYANCSSYFPTIVSNAPLPTPPRANEADDNVEWMFDAVSDYCEQDIGLPSSNKLGNAGTLRNDSLSAYQALFEVRTHHHCQRIWMFHHLPAVQNVGINCPVRSTDFEYSFDKSPAGLRNTSDSDQRAASLTG